MDGEELLPPGELASAKLKLLQYLLDEEGVEPAQDEGVQPRLDPNDLRMSFAQQRLWFLDQWSPGGAAYNICSAFRLHGDLDVAALSRSLDELVRRHEVLRTTFGSDQGRPALAVIPELRVPLPLCDLEDFTAEAQQTEAAHWLALGARRPFDLARGPLVRAALLRLSEREHMLLLAMHHIVSDGWSLGIVAREIVALYGVFASGERSPLPDLRIQYADFACWQRDRLQGDFLKKLLAYWRRQLADAPTLLELPTDRPRPPLQTFEGADRTASLPLELAESLREMGRREGATPFMVLLAAFVALLSRYSGSQDLVVGTPIANRTRPETEDLIGLFVNTLALRADLAGDPTFRELLARVRRMTLEAHEYQDVPFEMLVDDLGLTRELSHSPLFQVLFALQNTPRSHYRLRDLELSSVQAATATAKFDLTLAWVESGREMGCVAEYRTDLFDASTIVRLLNHLETMLSGIVKDPDHRISELPLLSGAERDLLGAWNNTALDRKGRGQGGTLHAFIEAQAERTPEAVAVEFEGVEVTYAELELRANRLANLLLSLGVGPDVAVGICAERSIELVVGLLGILKAGGAYLPLDPSSPRERLVFMAYQAGAPVVLAQPGLEERVTGSGAAVVRLVDDLGSGLPGVRPAAGSGPRNLAYVIYTSGSTGRPKGVMNTHKGIVNRLLWMQEAYRLTPEDRVLQKTAFTFDVSVWELFWPLIVGARLVVARPGGHQDSAYLVQVIAEKKITTAHFVPSMLSVFLAEEGISRCTVLRRVVCSGEALQPELRDRFFALLPETTALYNLYGPTEAAVDVTCWTCVRGDGRRTVPIGRPIANLQTHVVDSHLRRVPVGIPGELLLGGVGLARGYAASPELTAEKFVPDALSGQPGERLYRTGDLVRWLSDGTLEYLGRIDHQVKIRGFRIELGEVETTLAQHPAVREVVVTAPADAGGDRRLVAYLVGRDESSPAIEELRAFLESRLPGYMIPAAFVALPDMPRNASGKVDRRALPAPNGQRPRLAQVYVPPRNATERILADIWSQVTGVERVGVHDSFFALGGDSIRSIRVIALAREKGLSLSLPQLFQYQTVAGLAAQVAEVGPGNGAGSRRTAPFELVSAEDRARMPGDVEDAYPMATLQAGMFYHLDLTPDSPAYHNVDSIHLRAVFDATCFQQAVDDVVARHPTLRTSFHQAGYSQPLQLVHRHAAMPVAVADLRGLPPAAQEREVAAMVERERFWTLDPSRAPLMRLHVCLRSEDTFQLTVTENHAISDGWSLHATLRELFDRYFVLLDGGQSSIPPPVITYRDFVASELQALGSAEQRRFWEDRLEGCEPSQVPRRQGPQAVGGPRMRVFSLAIPRATTEALRALALGVDAPLKSALLAAHVKVMSLLAGHADVLTGLASNGRPEELDGEEVRGLFLNMIPFRLHVAPGSWAELVRNAFEKEIEQLPYRRFPMGALQKTWGDQPLLETAFTYVHFHSVEELVHSGRLEVLGFIRAEQTHFPLAITFTVSPITSQLALLIDADANRLPEALIEAIPGYFLSVLAAMATRPAARHEDFDALAPAERHRLLRELNDTATVDPARSLHDPVERQAARAPEALALVFGDERVTYAELEARSNRLAHHLQALGVGPDRTVAVGLERSVDLIVALLGVLKAGGAYLPFDPASPAERLAWVLADARPVALLSVQGITERLREAVAGVPLVLLDADRAEIEARSPARPVGEVDAESLAYVIYTSGSTGRPKGVMVPHRAIANRVRWMSDRFSLAMDDRVAQKTPVVFDASIWELFLPLWKGATLVVAEPGGHQDTAYLARLVAEQRVTVLQLVPSLLGPFLAEPGIAACRDLRRLFCGGEALPAELARLCAERLPAVELVNLYGPTEAAIDASSMPFRPNETLGSTVPIGRPIDNVAVHLLGPWSLPVPQDVAGHLHIGGAGLARGYLGRPDLTAAAFVPDPFSGVPGARLYRTGDLTRRRPDGAVEYLGRLDSQTKLRGFRIELGEIETLLGSHPGVRQAVAVVREDTPGDRRLVAYAVPAELAPAVAELTAFLAERLPEYMVPSALVLLPELPRTAGGKLDRRALPVPESLAEEAPESGFAAPRTPVEEILASICAQVLGRDQVSLRDSFLELGGHSLQAIQLTARLRQTFKIELKMRSVLQTADLAALAALIERAIASGSRVETPPLERAPRSGELPLSFAQQRLWFLNQIAPESPMFNIAMPVRLTGALDLDALARSLSEIVRRHETLRTVFPSQEGQPVQRIGAAFAVDLLVTDLQPLPAEEREREMRERVAKAAAKPFDLERGPLFRAELLRLSEQEHVGVLCMHHIISDGWSTGVLVRELAALYEAFTAGRPSPLPELPIQYADFAAWQRQWLSGEVLDRQLAYWTGRLQGAPPLLALPSDRPRPEIKSSRGGVLARSLAGDLAGRLEALAHQEGCTLFMVLLGAFDALLGQQVGIEDLVVGTDVASRDRLETEGLIGFFVNQLALRVDLSGDPTFRELLGRVREATLGGYAHQDLPFERLVQVLRPERSVAYTPLFQVKLNLQNLPTSQVDLAGLSMAPVSLGRTVVELDLIVNVIRTAGGLLVSVEYSTDLFEPARIDHLLDGFESVLATVAAQPESRLSEVAAHLAEADARFIAARAADLAAARRQIFQSVRRTPQAGGGAS